MSKRLERIFKITIPESQKVLVLPCHPIKPRDYIEHTFWLEQAADEGWLWQGQMQRNWHTEGRIEAEFFDVFHRTPQTGDR
jgi:hypothetical protein